MASAFAAAIVVVALALALVVTSTPQAHPIRTSGAIALAVQFPRGWVPYRGLVPSPTTSLRQMRCGAWSALSAEACPDQITLVNGRFWPDLTQSPNVLYVALSSESPGSGTSGGINVEYDPVQRALTIHDYMARALYTPYHADQTPGAELQPTLVLLVIDTGAISAGEITVLEDAWIERLTGDETTGITELGTVRL